MKSEYQGSLPPGSSDRESPEPLFAAFYQLLLPAGRPEATTFKKIKYFAECEQISRIFPPCLLPFSAAAVGSPSVRKPGWRSSDP